MFKGLGNLASMMRQAQQMGGKMQEVQQELQAKRVTGSAGGGMVSVEMNGLGDVIKVEIEPSLIEQGEREMIQDLAAAAFNQGKEKTKQLYTEAMQSLTSGMDVPGLNDAIEQITGNSGGAS